MVGTNPRVSALQFTFGMSINNSEPRHEVRNFQNPFRKIEECLGRFGFQVGKSGPRCEESSSRYVLRSAEDSVSAAEGNTDFPSCPIMRLGTGNTPPQATIKELSDYRVLRQGKTSKQVLLTLSATARTCDSLCCGDSTPLNVWAWAIYSPKLLEIPPAIAGALT